MRGARNTTGSMLWLWPSDYVVEVGRKAPSLGWMEDERSLGRFRFLGKRDPEARLSFERPTRNGQMWKTNWKRMYQKYLQTSWNVKLWVGSKEAWRSSDIRSMGGVFGRGKRHIWERRKGTDNEGPFMPRWRIYFLLKDNGASQNNLQQKNSLILC